MKLVKCLINLFSPKKPAPIVELEKPAEVIEEKIEEPVKESPKMPNKNYLSLPLPEKDGSMEHAVPLLKMVEAITGVDAKYMALIVDLESGFRKAVKAPTSSARGWFQFIDRTYFTMLSRHSKTYSIPTDSKYDLRNDPRVSSLLGAELIKENIRIIRPVIGRHLTLLEVYIAHFLGAGTAKKFLTLDSDVVVADILPKQAKANTWVFFEKNGNPRTVKQVNEYLHSRIAKSLKSVEVYFN